MTEKELLEKIKQSAEEIEIPKSLEPEEIEKMLNTKKMRKNYPQEKEMSGGKYDAKQGFFSRFANRKVIVAASVFLVCSVCGIAAAKSGIFTNSIENVVVGDDYTSAETASNDSIAEEAVETVEEAAAGESTSDTNIATDNTPDAGELYQVASSYQEVYELLDQYRYDSSGYGVYDEIFREEINEVVEKEEMSVEAEEFSSSNSATNDAVKEQTEAAATDSVSETGGAGNYSTTNLQTQGVDESDIVKTDGKYIYTVSQNQILITDIQGEQLKNVGNIKLHLDGESETVLEMYVDNGRLILITSRYDTSLTTNAHFREERTYDLTKIVEAATEAIDTFVQGISAEEAERIVENAITEEVEITEVNDADTLAASMVQEDVEAYHIEREVCTVIYTYDVSNPEEPKLLGSVKQDGSYHTSRKIDDVVYLFTDENLYNNTQPVDEVMRDSGEYLPMVNEEEIPYDRIYLPKEGSQALIISSVNVGNPSAIVDKAMILNNYVEIYVGSESCYLYNSTYQNGKDMTEIAKFTFSDGVISAVNAATVEGMIYDTFAINEKNGKLRVLTTKWDDVTWEESNNLYLLDEQLSITGTLTDIALGEQIYAARYIGDIVYFITYRNMDPLFAVDISDETSPKLLGELEITGFSEYLHPWGEDKLLGIGYETDPDTGIEEGIKLVMFDISNPTELKILDTLVIENIDYCTALYNYKCVIAEENANIIGFATETYSSSYSQREINYLAFGWENGKFVNLLAEGLTKGVDSSIYRGIYVGDKFYIASPEQIRSFDRSNNYKKLDELVF